MNHTKLNIIYEDSNLVVVNKECNQNINLEYLPLNNLSKEVSGILIFLKNSNAKNDYKIKYSYLGIVEGYMEMDTNYKVINRKERCSVVEFTSFFNDTNLRESLMKSNHSIIGDYKYKSRINPIRRICLHLYKIELQNELNRQVIYSSIPDSFKVFLA